MVIRAGPLPDLQAKEGAELMYILVLLHIRIFLLEALLGVCR